MAPLVTIALPVYRRLDYLPQALESVRAQDYPNVELLLSDNGPNGDRLPAMAAAAFRADSSSGTIRSASPCTTSTGIRIFARSRRKSVVPNAVMHCCVASGLATQAIDFA